MRQPHHLRTREVSDVYRQFTKKVVFGSHKTDESEATNFDEFIGLA